MVSLTFVFNQEKVATAGSTEEELLRPMREHAEKYGIIEDKNGVFFKDGEDAFCVLTMVIPKMAKSNMKILNLLEQWTLNVDGEEEDCIQESIEWFKEYDPQKIVEIGA